MPWAYKDKKIRPYMGASWAVVNLNQDAENEQLSSSFSAHKILFDAGLVYGKKNMMIRLGVNYNPNNEWNYPISKAALRKEGERGKRKGRRGGKGEREGKKDEQRKKKGEIKEKEEEEKEKGNERGKRAKGGKAKAKEGKNKPTKGRKKEC
ncbi:MAG: hypothetical protein U5N85_14095 [Arcicella sp.]|nr:hypothetical protein [Arcicella sp.]